ncbi:MAG TPA: sugar ABC transporter substrate-binding protein [Thermomicrobiales bacterium]|nr:sugar ABC transporter substrate-binding protein [Thermomicrobiales bacterium]
MAATRDPRVLPSFGTLDRRALLRRAAAAGIAVPAFSQFLLAPASAASDIKFVAMDYDANMQKDTQKLVDAFNKSQGDVKTTLQVVSWSEGHDRLVTWISGNQAPDLANVSAGWMVEFNAIEALEPLDDKFSPGFLDAFVPSTLDAMKIDGKLMGLPYFLDPRALYYRKDLFEKAGLQPPTTWDEVRAAAKALHNPPDVFGIGLSSGAPSGGYDYYEYAFIGAGGINRYGEDGKSLLNSPQGVKAAQFLLDLAITDKTTQPNPVNATRDSDLQPLFMAGKLAMLETGSWFPTMLKENAPDLQYGVAKLPMSDKSIPYHGAYWPDSMVMFKQSKNKEAAAKFLEYQFNKQNRLDFALQRGVIPERIDVGEDPKYASDETAKFFVEELKTAINVYAAPYPHENQAFEINAAELAKAFLGEQTAQEAMDKAAAQINKVNGVS